MRVTSLKYEKKVNLGNYEHEAVGIELALGDEDKALEALENAKKFVEIGLKGAK